MTPSPCLFQVHFHLRAPVLQADTQALSCCVPGLSPAHHLEQHTHTETNSPTKSDNGKMGEQMPLQPLKDQMLLPFTVQKACPASDGNLHLH